MTLPRGLDAHNQAMRLLILLLACLALLVAGQQQSEAARRRMERRVERLRVKYVCAKALLEKNVDIIERECPQDDARARLAVIERMCRDADRGWLNRTDVRLCDPVELAQLQTDADNAEAADSG